MAGRSERAWLRRQTVAREYCIYGRRVGEIARVLGVNYDTIRMDMSELRRRYEVRTNAQLCYRIGKIRESLGYE